jgi:hypothetical protein
MNAQLVILGSDTIVNTATVSVTQTFKLTYAVASFQAVVTKVSGTVAGTIILEASNDGTNYAAISVDTLNLTNVATNTKLWAVTSVPYKYYRLKGTGIGTMAAILKWYCVLSDK